MRLRFLFLLLIIALLTVAAELVSHDPGYLLLSYGSHLIETSLIVASILLAFTVLLILMVIVALSKLFGVRAGVAEWMSTKSVKAAREKTNLGLIELAEGHWTKAKRLLGEAAIELEYPLINYISAARAADELDDIEGRDEFLRLAHETKNGNPDLAVGLTRAQLHYQRKDWERCLATLQRLHEKAPKHAYVIKMLVTVYQETGEWERLSLLMPAVRKIKRAPFNEEELNALESHAYEQWLKSVLRRKPAESQQSAQLLQIWQKVPSRQRNEEHIVATFCECCVETGEQNRASELLEKALARDWSDRLVDLYGKLELTNTEHSLEKARDWLAERPNSASLLLALGRISMRRREWDNAQDYFERSLAARISAEVYGELGRLLASRGEHQVSSDYFQKGLAMLVNGLPELPLPQAT